MSGKDYYAILGVTPETGPDEIRAAFRNLAKRHHPDGNDQRDDGRFRDIAEAYEVLSDPDKRRRYHRNRRPSESVGGDSRSGGRNVRFGRGAFSGKRSRSEAPLERMMRNMFRARMAAGGGALIELEVTLDADEARTGVAADVEVPVDRLCAACGGRGGDGFRVCRFCGGRGLRRVAEAVRIRFPAGVRDRSVSDISLVRNGRPAGTLRLYVRVANP